MHVRRLIGAGFSAILVAFGTLAVGTQGKPVGEWRYFGGDKGHTRYSPLDQINRDNVGEAAGPLAPSRPRRAVHAGLSGPEPVPVLPGDADRGRRRAVCPECRRAGRSVRRRDRQDALGAGADRSGPAGRRRAEHAWRGHAGTAARIDASSAVRGPYLYALNAKTGRTLSEFRRPRPCQPETGRAVCRGISLRPPARSSSAMSSSIAGNGGGGGDLGARKEAAPEDVRGYDVRDRQTAVDLPRAAAARRIRRRHLGQRASLLRRHGRVGRAERGRRARVRLRAAERADQRDVRRPSSGRRTSTPTALVCLDAKTGKRVWHYQMVHHDLWDYDNVGAPVLGDITVNGRRIKAVMQPNKTAFLYVFDRVTGRAGVADRGAAGAAVDGAGRTDRGRRSRSRPSRRPSTGRG